MNWKFWQKDDEHELLNQIKYLTEKMETMEEKIDELNSSKKKMDRLQYKQNQDLLKKTEELSKKIEKQGVDQELISNLKNKIDNYSLNTEKTSNKLIDFIDEFDLIRRGLEKDEARWNNLLENWSHKMLKLLEQSNIYHLNLRGKQFNPRLAEAISTVDSKGIEEYSDKSDSTCINNEIVEVIKRGYKDEEDNLIRKALVIVYKEDN